MPDAFEYYKRINQEVFQLHQEVTLKISVLINQPIESKSHEIFINKLHNEFITNNNSITTNIKYKYSMSLSPKKFYSYGISLDWEVYSDFLDFVDKIVFLTDEKNEYSPFKIIKNEFGETINIKCDNTLVKSINLEDQFGNYLEAKPIIISYKNNTIIKPGVRLIFGEQPDLSFDITIKRFYGLQRFLLTFNPLILASNMVNYLVTTPLLGTNKKILK